MLDDMAPVNVSSVPTRTVVRVSDPPPVEVTQPSIGQLTDQAGALRANWRVLQDHIDDVHQQLSTVLVSRRAERLKEDPKQLLTDLSDLGFAWRHIAMMVGVSVPAVQKWRKGEKPSAENFDRLAILLAICDLLSSFMISDPASWFEVRILPDVPIRPMDLFARREDALLLDWASQHEVNGERLLDRAVPGWRETLASPFEVFDADDGHPAIRFKEG
jgi:hypothetical protein